MVDLRPTFHIALEVHGEQYDKCSDAYMFNVVRVADRMPDAIGKIVGPYGQHADRSTREAVAAGPSQPAEEVPGRLCISNQIERKQDHDRSIPSAGRSSPAFFRRHEVPLLPIHGKQIRDHLPGYSKCRPIPGEQDGAASAIIELLFLGKLHLERPFPGCKLSIAVPNRSTTSLWS